LIFAGAFANRYNLCMYARQTRTRKGESNMGENSDRNKRADEGTQMPVHDGSTNNIHIALGTVMGVVFGSIFSNIALGVALGICFGVAFGIRGNDKPAANESHEGLHGEDRTAFGAAI
jgi:hypothetical protein